MTPSEEAALEGGTVPHVSNLERSATGIYVIWLREFKRFWRDTPRRIGAFVQPLIYLFLLGTGLQSAFTAFGAGSTNYVIFMFPGILGMTILFTSVFSAISILWDREFGFLKEVLVSPVPRSAVALGKVVGGATTAFIQGIILMVLMFLPNLFGFNLETLWKILLLLPVCLLLSLGMTSLGVAIAARMKSFEGFPVIMNFILLPLFFLSGAMFPLQGLPGWMDVLVKINPLSYGVDLLRGIALSGVALTSGPSLNVTKVAGDIVSRIQESVPGLPAGSLERLKAGIEGGISQAVPTGMSNLAETRFPVWLDLLVIVGFGVLMSVIAIWQFNRQE